MLKFKTSCAVLAYLSSNLLNEVGLSLFRYFEVGLRVCDIAVNKFTFAISSPDEFLLPLRNIAISDHFWNFLNNLFRFRFFELFISATNKSLFLYYSIPTIRQQHVRDSSWVRYLLLHNCTRLFHMNRWQWIRTQSRGQNKSLHRSLPSITT